MKILKSYISASVVFAVLLLTVPAAPLAVSRLSNEDISELSTEADSNETFEETEDIQENTEKTDIKEVFEDEKLKVLDITTGKVEEISSYDYVVGAVCAEMPASFEKEALKAQAVAAYTYALRQKEKAKTSPDTELGGAYFSNDSTKYQAFFTENQAKQYYGDNYEQFIENIRNAVSEVAGEYMTYDNQPIIAAFHSLSSGMTESAENVWGSSIPYLVSVKSEYDEKAPKYMEEYEFTDKEMKKLLESSFEEISLGDNPEKWFSDVDLSDAGTVLKIKAGDITVTGQEMRSALSLRSAAFEVNYEDGFKIIVKGCGHGVGMSQFGANEMAKSGKNHKEILKYYYKGVSITD